MATKKCIKKKESWEELPIGGKIIKPGNSKEYKTGNWRTFRPVTDFNKCIHCMKCWVVCPDNAIKVKDGKKTGTDLDFCKGCGLCAEVCPVKCIEMKRESDFEDKEKKNGKK